MRVFRARRRARRRCASATAASSASAACSRAGSSRPGVRFIEVSHNLNFLNGTGWDTHNEGICKQHAAHPGTRHRRWPALIADLEADEAARQDADRRRHRVRPPARVRRRRRPRPPGHGFTLVLAGGGLQHRGAYGATDELAKNDRRRTRSACPISTPRSTPPSASIPRKELYDGDRPVPITDGGTADRGAVWVRAGTRILTSQTEPVRFTAPQI